MVVDVWRWGGWLPGVCVCVCRCQVGVGVRTRFPAHVSRHETLKKPQVGRERKKERNNAETVEREREKEGKKRCLDVARAAKAIFRYRAFAPLHKTPLHRSLHICFPSS